MKGYLKSISFHLRIPETGEKINCKVNRRKEIKNRAETNKFKAENQQMKPPQPTTTIHLLFEEVNNIDKILARNQKNNKKKKLLLIS